MGNHKNRLGFTLIEIVLALALTGLAALGVISITEMSNKAQNSARTAAGMNQIRTEVGHFLQSPATCASRLVLGPANTGSPPSTQVSIYRSATHTPDNLIVGNQPRPKEGLILKAKLQDLELQSMSGVNRVFVGNLVIEGDRSQGDTKRNYAGSDLLRAEIPISITFNPGNQMIACSVQPSTNYSDTPLFGGNHTAQDCADQNGIIWPVDGSFICRIPNMDPGVLPNVNIVDGKAVMPTINRVVGFPPSAFCPAGWQLYRNYHKSRTAQYNIQTCHSGGGSVQAIGNGQFSDTPTVPATFQRKSGSMPYCNSWQETGYPLIDAAGCY